MLNGNNNALFGGWYFKTWMYWIKNGQRFQKSISKNCLELKKITILKMDSLKGEQNIYLDVSSFLNIIDDSNIIFAQVWTRNKRWYSSKMVSSMFHRPLVLIRLFKTEALSRSSQCCSPCSRGCVRVMSSGHHSMYSSIDLA